MPMIRVGGTTIDKFCHSERVKHVALVKMDIEDSEMRAVRGMHDLLSSSQAPAVLCEVKRISSDGWSPVETNC
jgi:hypothetical protein